MIIISYDIHDDKLRTKFSKYLKKFGHRLQYSVFEISNSKHILSNIELEIKSNFEKKFTQQDSILIFNMSEACKITKYGYAKNDENTIIII